MPITPGLFFQVAAAPDFLEEDFRDHLSNTLRPGADSINYSRLFPASRQLIASPIAGASLVFEDLQTTRYSPRVVGATALHGRLPSGLTLAGIGIVTMRTARDLPLGFAVRLQQDVGSLSRVGIAGTIGPFRSHFDIGQSTYAMQESAAELSWDLRAQRNTTRVVGQIAVACRREAFVACGTNCETAGWSKRKEIVDAYSGFAGHLEYGELGWRLNWFARLEVVNDYFLAGPYAEFRSFPEVVASTGVRPVITRGNRFMRQGKFSITAQLRRWYPDLEFKESALTAHAAVVTAAYNEVYASAGASRFESNAWRFSFDFSASSDTRRNWIVVPGFGVTSTTIGARNSLAFLRVGARLGQRITMDMVLGSANRRFGGDELDEYLLAAANHSSSRAAAARTDLFAHLEAVRNCVYGTYLGIFYVESLRCSFGHVNGRLAVFPTIDLEAGVLVKSAGYQMRSCGTDDNPHLLDSRLDFFMGIRWEYRPGSVIRVGAYETRIHEAHPAAARHSIGDLASLPIDGQQEWTFVVRMSRKLWR